MNTRNLYMNAVKAFGLDVQADVKDYAAAEKGLIPQLKEDIPNAVIIWLSNGRKVIYIED